MDAYAWLIEHVDRTYQEGNWAGTGVRPALEGVSAELAGWRPHPEQHTIAEIALHMAYWKDAVGARLAERHGPTTRTRTGDRHPPRRKDGRISYRSSRPRTSGS